MANKGGKELYDYILKLICIIRQLFGVDAVEAPEVGKLLGKASNDDIVVTSKRQKVEERQKNKNDDIKKELDERGLPEKIINKKRFKEFTEKWEGKSIAKLTKKEIVDNLRGFTEQGNRIAKLIDDSVIKIKILLEKDFVNYYLECGGTLKNALKSDAFSYGDIIVHKSTTNIKNLLSEIVHEGTHSKDYLDNLLDIENSWEKRARFYERAFQEATGMEKDFETIGAMLTFIKKEY